MSENREQTPKRGHGPMGGGMHMMGHGAKAKNFKATFKRLILLLAPQKLKFISVFILAVASTVFAIVGPKVLGMATTKLGEGFVKASSGIPNAFDMPGIARILLIMAGLYVLSAGLSFLTNFIMADVAQKTALNMRRDIKDKLDRLPLKYFDSRTHGEILSRVTNDMDNISQTLQQSMTQIITSVVSVLGTIVMMLSISPELSLIALITLPASMLIMTFIMKNSQKFYSDQQKIIGNINGHVEEMFTAHKAVKAFGHEELSKREFSKMNDALYSVGWKAQFISGIIHPALNFVTKLAYVAICVVGGIFVTNGRIKIGDIQAFIQYSNNFAQPIGQIANIANILQSTMASAERVFEILDEEEEIPESAGSGLEDVKGDVDISHVKFSYSKDTTLISDLNLHAKSGQTVAIVGPTGAGKTTLVNLLMRFYELSSGDIKIDGVDITKIPRSRLRKNFGMVLQDTWLFSGTIYDNIAYGNENATKEDVKAASKAALAHRFIRTLPDGYDTILNEEASNISQGQRQLLTIARAILANPSILILDEATSNVDTRTEVLIQKAMLELMQNRTSFVIAHRLSTIRNADTILVMNHGDIIEQGNHHELLEKNGFYAELYNSQFDEEACS